MQPHGLEPQMEEFLLRIVPGLAQQWQGADADEIAQIEALAGRPLPPFYRWFLARMGHNMGELAYPRLDFSVPRVLACYAEQLVAPQSRFLLIGHESDEMMPLHVFYDLDRPARRDALVTKRHAFGGDLHDQFETFREKLAWGAFSSFRVQQMPQRCSVVLSNAKLDILDPVLNRLGFTKPEIPAGSTCAIYERADAALLGTKSLSLPVEGFMSFDLGGQDSLMLRRLIGEIVTASAVRVSPPEWEPPLV